MSKDNFTPRQPTCPRCGGKNLRWGPYISAPLYHVWCVGCLYRYEDAPRHPVDWDSALPKDTHRPAEPELPKKPELPARPVYVRGAKKYRSVDEIIEDFAEPRATHVTPVQPDVPQLPEVKGHICKTFLYYRGGIGPGWCWTCGKIKDPASKAG